ncbi:MAG: serine hydrolase [Pirellulaceae bacterium]
MKSVITSAWFGVVMIVTILTWTPSCAAQAFYESIPEEAFLREWLVLGPYVAEEKNVAAVKRLQETDLLSDVGTESGIAPSANNTATYKEQTHTWKHIESGSDNIDLLQHVGNHEYAIAYAFATIQSPSEQTRLLSVGSDDGVRVWLNGELVHDNPTARALNKDDDVVAITLKEGDNRLLLKIANGIREWGFNCHLLTSDSAGRLLAAKAARGDSETVQMLLDAGADVNSRTWHGATAYHAAKMSGQAETIKLLEDRKADATVELPLDDFTHSVLAENADAEKPGTCVLIARDGKVVATHAVGMANLEDRVPITRQTRFRIGSVTKQFTAAAILKLQEQGKLNVDDLLSKYYPEVPNADKITLHHLLTHTSGLANFTDAPEFYATVAAPVSNEEMLDSFRDKPVEFQPGEKWKYCNTGYFLLGMIVEQVSEKSFDEFLRETFFAPLGMTHTGVHDARTIIEHEARGYGVDGTDGGIKKARAWDMTRAGGAGNIYSTVDDLFLWNEALFHGKVLSDESLKAAFTPVTVTGDESPMLSYGYGWVIDEFRGLRRIGHDGGLDGFLSRLIRYPDQNVTIVVFHNAMPPVAGLNPVNTADLLSAATLWRETKATASPTIALDVDPATYRDYVGFYRYGAGAIMEVSLDDNRLYAQLTGQPRFEIYPGGGDTFFWKVVQAQVEFLRDEEHKVTSARHTQNSVTFTAPRVAFERNVHLAPEVLDRYVGSYKYSLLQSMAIRRDGERLFAKMTLQPEYEIFPTSETNFQWLVVDASIEFLVDENGKVAAAKHTQNGSTFEVKKTK